MPGWSGPTGGREGSGDRLAGLRHRKTPGEDLSQEIIRPRHAPVPWGMRNKLKTPRPLREDRVPGLGCILVQRVWAHGGTAPSRQCPSAAPMPSLFAAAQDSRAEVQICRPIGICFHLSFCDLPVTAPTGTMGFYPRAGGTAKWL